MTKRRLSQVEMYTIQSAPCHHVVIYSIHFQKKDDVPGRQGSSPYAHRLIFERSSLPVIYLSASSWYDLRVKILKFMVILFISVPSC